MEIIDVKKLERMDHMISGFAIKDPISRGEMRSHKDKPTLGIIVLFSEGLYRKEHAKVITIWHEISAGRVFPNLVGWCG